MTRLIKAYSRRDKTIIELSTLAVSENSAKYKGLAFAFGRRFTRATEYESCEVVEFKDGTPSEYRVIITTDSQASVKDSILSKLEEAI